MKPIERQLFYVFVVLWAIAAGTFYITRIPWTGYLMWTFVILEWVCILPGLLRFVRYLILKK